MSTRVTKSFKATTLGDLVTQVNAYLAPFVGGSSRNIIWADMVLNYYPRQFTDDFEFVITTDTVATAPATSPFQLVGFAESNPTDLDALIAAYYVAHPAYFTIGARIVSQLAPRRLNTMTCWFLANATAADAGNYTPK